MNQSSKARTASSMQATHLSSPSCISQAANVLRRNLHRTLKSSLDVWEYSPGEYQVRPKDHQSAWVLAGRAEVEIDDGRVVTLCAGATVFLPRGLNSRWVVKETLKTVTARGR